MFYGVKKFAVFVSIFERTFYAKARNRELAVDKIFEVIGAAVFKKQKLLCHQITVLRNCIKFRAVFIECLVDFLEDSCQGPCFADKYIFVLKCFCKIRRFFDAVEQTGFIKAVFVARVDDDFKI